VFRTLNSNQLPGQARGTSKPEPLRAGNPRDMTAKKGKAGRVDNSPSKVTVQTQASSKKTLGIS